MKPTLLSLFIAGVIAGHVQPAAAADAGDRDQGLVLAREARETHDDALARQALALLTPHAIAGDAEACWQVGYLHFIGRGTPRNLAFADRFMRCAADAGNPSAAFWVAGGLDADLTRAEAANPERSRELRHYLAIAIDGGHQGATQLFHELPTLAPAQPRRAVARKDEQGEVANSPLQVATVDAPAPPAVTISAPPPSRIALALDLLQRVELPARPVLMPEPMPLELERLDRPRVEVTHAAPPLDRPADLAVSPVPLARLSDVEIDARIDELELAPGALEYATASTVDAAIRVPTPVSEPALQRQVLRTEDLLAEPDTAAPLDAPVAAIVGRDRARLESAQDRAAGTLLSDKDEVTRIKAQTMNEEGLRQIARRNFREGARLLEKAAELGHPAARANLGLLYLTGDGVRHDPIEARRLFEQAAAEGNRVAAENMGRIFELAIGVKRDLATAVAWYERAQELGSVRATSALVRLRVTEGAY